jgi:hypothetical protein
MPLLPRKMKQPGPRPVSKWFRFHWQYVLAFGRFPAFKPVAVVVAALPAFGGLAVELNEDTTGFWFVWWGSITSIAAFLITWWRCPRLVRENERFKDYEDVGHSHRWIGWLLHLSRPTFVNLAKLVDEAIDKGMALPAYATVIACPIMSAAPPTSGRYAILLPVNLNRDLYIGIWRDGYRYILALEEKDKDLGPKVKELYWMMFSDLVASRPRWRFVVWLLYAATFVLLALAVGLNLARPLDGLLTDLDRWIWGWPV